MMARLDVTQGNEETTNYFGTLEQARLPLSYMARLFCGGQ